MKKIFLIPMMLLSLTAFAQSEGGGHVGIDVGTSPYKFYRAMFGYNMDTGNAWVIAEFGEDRGVDGGSIWDSDPKPAPVAGLTLNLETREIEYNGIPCAKARPYKFGSGDDYPVTMYSNCRFSEGPSWSTRDFTGATTTHRSVNFDVTAAAKKQ